MAKRKSPRRRTSGAAPARVRGPLAPSASVRYIESSALAAALLEHDMTAVPPFSAETRHVTSALTIAEVGRAIIRARATSRLTELEEQAAVRALRTFERRSYILDVERGVLARVRRPFPIEPIRTLDAVHLATLEALGELPQLVAVVTRDSRVRDNARALGYVVQ